MSERKRIGGLSGPVDPAVMQWQAQAAENPATVSAKRRKDRARTRIHIDVDAATKIALETAALAEDTSLSQVCELLLAYGLHTYIGRLNGIRDALRTDRTPARTPRFGWNVAIPAAWLSEIDQFSDNGKADGKVDGRVNGKV